MTVINNLLYRHKNSNFCYLFGNMPRSCISAAKATRSAWTFGRFQKIKVLFPSGWFVAQLATMQPTAHLSCDRYSPKEQQAVVVPKRFLTPDCACQVGAPNLSSPPARHSRQPPRRLAIGRTWHDNIRTTGTDINITHCTINAFLTITITITIDTLPYKYSSEIMLECWPGL